MSITMLGVEAELAYRRERFMAEAEAERLANAARATSRRHRRADHRQPHVPAQGPWAHLRTAWR